ncbi:MAG: hypothetical protein MZV64_25200 [Ignavibacteriales bacterium]|nr:hypothetical protein [Ignavibacteriales bacterium]
MLSSPVIAVRRRRGRRGGCPRPRWRWPGGRWERPTARRGAVRARLDRRRGWRWPRRPRPVPEAPGHGSSGAAGR